MAQTYEFATQLADGQAGEQRLDRHFGQWFHIIAANEDQQRRGIDRIYLDLRDGRRWTVEYKTDHTASHTGNAFVETVSVQTRTTRKPGWAATSAADWLVYFLPECACAYLIRMWDLRQELRRWAGLYPVRDVPNQGYVTRGLLVPLAEFEEIAHEVISL